MGDGFAAQGAYEQLHIKGAHNFMTVEPQMFTYRVEYFSSRPDEDIQCSTVRVVGEMVEFRTGLENAYATDVIILNSCDIRRIEMVTADD